MSPIENSMRLLYSMMAPSFGWLAPCFVSDLRGDDLSTPFVFVSHVSANIFLWVTDMSSWQMGFLAHGESTNVAPVISIPASLVRLSATSLLLFSRLRSYHYNVFVLSFIITSAISLLYYSMENAKMLHHFIVNLHFG